MHFQQLVNNKFNIGVTPSDEDKNRISKGCSGFMNLLINKFGWHYKLTYKTLLKYFGCICRTKLVKNSFLDYGNSN